MQESNPENKLPSQDGVVSDVMSAFKNNFKLIVLHVILLRVLPFFLTALLLRIVSLQLGFVYMKPYGDILLNILIWIGIARVLPALSAVTILSKLQIKTPVVAAEYSQLSKLIYKNHKTALFLFTLGATFAFMLPNILGVAFVFFLSHLFLIKVYRRMTIKQAFGETFRYLKRGEFAKNIIAVIGVSVMFAVVLGIIAFIFSMFLMAFELLPYELYFEIKRLLYGTIWVAALGVLYLAFSYAYLKEQVFMTVSDLYIAYLKGTSASHSRYSETRTRFEVDSKPHALEKETHKKLDKERSIADRSRKFYKDRFDYENQPNRFTDPNKVKF